MRSHRGSDARHDKRVTRQKLVSLADALMAGERRSLVPGSQLHSSVHYAIQCRRHALGDENDILKFDLEIELACDAGTSNDLERLTCSIAIVRPRVLTPLGPIGEVG